MKGAISTRAARILVLVTALLGLGAGIGYATIPAGGGRINGCYEKRTGILRVIDSEAGAKCTSFETPITWNQQGQRGPTGPAGAGERGPTGPKGEAGAIGMRGPTGAKGDVGAAGADGRRGPTGATGARGAEGAAGRSGPTGPAGATGARGPAGADGAGGDRGPTGARGPAGASGPTGARGPTGSRGPQGATGPTGPAGVPGPPGPKGDRGIDGVNVSSRAIGPGANCPYGGSSFASISGTTFACNGAPGERGAAGAGVFAHGSVAGLALSQAGRKNLASAHYDNDAKEWYVQYETPPANPGACVPVASALGAGLRTAGIGGSDEGGVWVFVEETTTHQLLPGGFTLIVVCA